MATYKVLQDIEAEDKLIGPLSPRQFIYASVSAVSLGLMYFVITHGAGVVAIVFLPFAIVGGFFAFPWGRDQPTEIWALAKIRFLLKARRRLWDQSGVKELVKITVPKKIERNYSNGLSQTEVKSRLRALADTIDSRGWVIKNANLNIGSGMAGSLADTTSDRLAGPLVLPTDVDSIDVQAADDILDEKSNQRAQRLDTLITTNAKARRNKIMEEMAQAPKTPAPTAPNDYWFLNQNAAKVPSDMATFNTQLVTPGATTDGATATPAAPAIDEATLLSQLDAQKEKSGYKNHLRTIIPISKQSAQQAGAQPIESVDTAPISPPAAPTPIKPAAPPASSNTTMRLSGNNDLNVATIAREAQRSKGQGEVVIKLH